jgi:hypothetical protein
MPDRNYGSSLTAVSEDSAMTRSTTRPVAAMYTCEFEATEDDIFVLLDGVRIAKRGYPNTPEARTWVSLGPGYTVRDNADLTQLIIELEGVRVHQGMPLATPPDSF